MNWSDFLEREDIKSELEKIELYLDIALMKVKQI